MACVCATLLTCTLLDTTGQTNFAHSTTSVFRYTNFRYRARKVSACRGTGFCAQVCRVIEPRVLHRPSEKSRISSAQEVMNTRSQTSSMRLRMSTFIWHLYLSCWQYLLWAYRKRKSLEQFFLWNKCDVSTERPRVLTLKEGSFYIHVFTSR